MNSNVMQCIAFDIANGLSYLHKFAIAHRNLKPSCIVISNGTCGLPSICAKISDFDVAEKYHMGSTVVSNMTSRTFVEEEELPFQAPEMILSGGDYFNQNELYKADVWSFGCILFCILNPDLRDPYIREYERSYMNEKLAKFMINTMTHRQLPEDSKKFPTIMKLQDIMTLCMEFDTKWRPDIRSVAWLVGWQQIPNYICHGFNSSAVVHQCITFYFNE